MTTIEKFECGSCDVEGMTITQARLHNESNAHLKSSFRCKARDGAFLCEEHTGHKGLHRVGHFMKASGTHQWGDKK